MCVLFSSYGEIMNLCEYWFKLKGVSFINDVKGANTLDKNKESADV